MPAIKRKNVYSEVVEITSRYLGPAADRFVARQIQNHLHKDPEYLMPRELLKLIGWIQVSMSFLTSDEALVNEYISKLRTLAEDNARS